MRNVSAAGMKRFISSCCQRLPEKRQFVQRVRQRSRTSVLHMRSAECLHFMNDLPGVILGLKEERADFSDLSEFPVLVPKDVAYCYLSLRAWR